MTKRAAPASLGEQPFTYAEFGDRVERLKQNLVRRGLKRGDRIAILGTGCPNWGTPSCPS